MRVLFGALALAVGLTVLAPAPATAQKRQRDLISREEIDQLQGVLTAYEAVKKLHGEWLRSKSRITNNAEGGGTVAPGPNVYVNGVRSGDVTFLESISLQTVQEMRFLTASQAESRFGSGNLAGVIAVTMRSTLKQDSTKPKP
ncbi:MAG: hypothetical protein HOP28_17235 [Gemmatimonadales bacterium]|nr:hypothetical protein [Gemmatimonadales bacterium]